MPPRHAGLTLSELLIVLSLITILTTVGAVLAARPTPARDARTLAAALTHARWQAVHLGAPVAIGMAPDRRVTRSVTTYGVPHCDGVTDADVIWQPSRRVNLSWPRHGLVFGPDGRPRRCDGSGVGNTTIVLDGPGGSQAAVIIASLGRVRWESR